MSLMKDKIIPLLCILILFGCQKNDIEVYNGKDTSFEKLKGQWIIVNYWADWCAPCIKEIPELVDFANKNKDIKVFAFNYDQLEIEDLKPIIKKFGVEVPSLITHPRDIWGIETPPILPATYFINEKGLIAASIFKPQTAESLQLVLNELRGI